MDGYSRGKNKKKIAGGGGEKRGGGEGGKEKEENNLKFFLSLSLSISLNQDHTFFPFGI